MRRDARGDDVNYELTNHASTVLAARGIEIAWLERALDHPMRTEADPKRSARTSPRPNR